MIRNLKTLVVLGLLLFSCREKEEPQPIFGEYLPQSATSEIALDFTGDGIVSRDLLDQLRSNGQFFDKSSGIIFLTLYSPEYFNLNFSQVVLRLPYHFLSENSVVIEYHQDGRRFDLEENGALDLSFNTYPPQFEFPQQFQENIVIESLKTKPGENQILELVVAQKLFDHSINDWIETKIAYSFLKEN